MDPSMAFKNLNKKGKFNFLVTSGTLTPFESWSSELGIGKILFQNTIFRISNLS